MDDRAVTLRSQNSDRGSWHLTARIRADGSLAIEGQDRGAGVAEFWGGDEYEWEMVIAPEDLAALVAALGGTAVDDPLELLARRYRQDERHATRSFLEEHRVPFRFWSRVGE